MPDLLDYLGFTEQMEVEEEQGEPIFEPHLPLEEVIPRTKKGELFEGKLNISRNNVEEGLFCKVKNVY